MMKPLIKTLKQLTPRMAGTTFRERTIACTGALLGIAFAGLISGAITGNEMGLPLLVAPMGASAVLLFAVPASPLAQPWSIVGGNTISALVGITAAMHIPHMAFAAAVAVAAAIGVMSLLRCLHPPGGAVALSAVLGGPAVLSLGYGFAFVPVGLNSLVLVLLGWVFHKFSQHSYPHRPNVVLAATHGTADPPPQLRVALTDDDIDTAIEDSGETFDIAREDLHKLLRRAELAALDRTRNVPRCADIMSRDVVSIGVDASWPEAHAVLIAHDLRILPVVDADYRVAGVVELHELERPARMVADVMAEPVTAYPDDSMLRLVDPLSDGRTHAAVITDGTGKLLGLITQTDLIVALARIAVSGVARDGKATGLRPSSGVRRP
jgi:CBS domain-containing membrane protein